jgi:predicted RNase H-like HicB family nuclease
MIKMRSGSDCEKPANIHVVIENDEDGYYVTTVHFKRLSYQAKTLDTMMKRTRKAIALCLETTSCDDSLELVGIQQLSI